jgi:hypothetical protein
MELEELQVTEPGATPSQVPPGQDKGSKEDNVTISRAELDALKRESNERAEAAKYWSGLHRQPRANEAAAETDEVDPREFLDEEEATDDGDTPEKLVNDLASKGAAGLKARGFLTAKDAEKLIAKKSVEIAQELIGRERQKVSSDAMIMAEFPELKDQNSELFKATATRYQRAVAMDPNAKKTPAALYLAAEAARESLKRTAPVKAREEEEEDRYNRPEREDDRRRRADSQDGRTRNRGEVDDRDMLGSEAKQIIAAMGISEDEYKASLKATGSRRRSR